MFVSLLLSEYIPRVYIDNIWNELSAFGMQKYIIGIYNKTDIIQTEAVVMIEILRDAVV